MTAVVDICLDDDESDEVVKVVARVNICFT